MPHNRPNCETPRFASKYWEMAALPFCDGNHVLFFWTEQYDSGLGHAEKWDRAEIAGSLLASDAIVGYWLGGKKLAMAIIHRDLDGLRAEVEFEAVIAGRQAMALVA